MSEKPGQNRDYEVRLSRAEIDGLRKLAKYGLMMVDHDPKLLKQVVGIPSQVLASRAAIAQLGAAVKVDKPHPGNPNIAEIGRTYRRDSKGHNTKQEAEAVRPLVDVKTNNLFAFRNRTG